MYACTHEIGGGSFAGVWGQDDLLLTFRDSPLPLLDSRIASGRHLLVAPSARVYVASEIRGFMGYIPLTTSMTKASARGIARASASGEHRLDPASTVV